MKIILLLAHSGEKKLEGCKKHIEMVLEELDIKVETIDLHTLPYYKSDQVSPVAALLSEKIQESKGVIALTSVHIGGMHSSMQSFLEHFTRYTYTIKDKPIFVITSTAFQGERKVAYEVLQAWSTLGGNDAGATYINRDSDMENVLDNLERQLETYYRVIKQDRVNIRCSEYYLYNKTSEHLLVDKEEKSQVAYSVDEMNEPLVDKPLHIDLSTKEQNIQELTQLLKQQIGYDQEKEFIELPSTTYTKPVGRMNEGITKGSLKINSIPHYFVAQHDKVFQATIQYILTDTQEKGTIKIKDGDCTYEESLSGNPTVEMIMTEEILNQILKKQLTYQKAFMIGKLKVKGNFGILAKLDQIFKSF